MSNIIKCKNCGADAVEGQAFCGECGQRIDEGTIGIFTPPVDKTKEKEIPAENKIKKWSIAGFIISIVGVSLLSSSVLNVIDGNSIANAIGMGLAGICYIILGLILLKKHIKSYGWLIPSILFGCAGLSGIIDKETFESPIGAVIFAAAFFIVFAIKNKKK